MYGASNDGWTFYYPHEKRGKEASEKTGHYGEVLQIPRYGIDREFHGFRTLVCNPNTLITD
jgi:hypothetical protein